MNFVIIKITHCIFHQLGANSHRNHSVHLLNKSGIVKTNYAFEQENASTCHATNPQTDYIHHTNSLLDVAETKWFSGERRMNGGSDKRM